MFDSCSKPLPIADLLSSGAAAIAAADICDGMAQSGHLAGRMTALDGSPPSIDWRPLNSSLGYLKKLHEVRHAQRR